MRAIEFETTPKNGVITLPDANLNLDNTSVKIIILINDEKTALSRTDEMNSILADIRRKNIFSGITDPSLWQRGIRNEW